MRNRTTPHEKASTAINTMKETFTTWKTTTHQGPGSLVVG